MPNVWTGVGGRERRTGEMTSGHSTRLTRSTTQSSHRSSVARPGRPLRPPTATLEAERATCLCGGSVPGQPSSRPAQAVSRRRRMTKTSARHHDGRGSRDSRLRRRRDDVYRPTLRRLRLASPRPRQLSTTQMIADRAIINSTHNTRQRGLSTTKSIRGQS